MVNKCSDTYRCMHKMQKLSVAQFAVALLHLCLHMWMSTRGKGQAHVD